MVSRVGGLCIPMVQFVEQFQPARCIAMRRAHPEPHFGVVFSQHPHGEFFHQLVQAHAAPPGHRRQPIAMSIRQPDRQCRQISHPPSARRPAWPRGSRRIPLPPVAGYAIKKRRAFQTICPAPGACMAVVLDLYAKSVHFEQTTSAGARDGKDDGIETRSRPFAYGHQDETQAGAGGGLRGDDRQPVRVGERDGGGRACDRVPGKSRPFRNGLGGFSQRAGQPSQAERSIEKGGATLSDSSGAPTPRRGHDQFSSTEGTRGRRCPNARLYISS